MTDLFGREACQEHDAAIREAESDDMSENSSGMTEEEKRACEAHIQQLLDEVSEKCNTEEMREVRNELQAILLSHFNYL